MTHRIHSLNFLTVEARRYTRAINSTVITLAITASEMRTGENMHGTLKTDIIFLQSAKCEVILVLSEVRYEDRSVDL